MGLTENSRLFREKHGGAFYLLRLCLLVDAISDFFGRNANPAAAERRRLQHPAPAFGAGLGRALFTRRPDPPGARVRAGITVKRVSPNPACGSQSIA